MFSQITVALALCVLGLWIRHRRKILQTFTDLGIPGPTPNILFGNLLEMYKKGPLKCHEEWIQKYGTVVGYYFGMRPVVLIGDLDGIKQVQIKEFKTFIDRANNLLSFVSEKSMKKFDFLVRQRGKTWKHTRNILTPAFSSVKLKQMSPIVIDAINETMELVEEHASEKREFDIHRLWQGLTADVIGRTAFGIEAGVQRNEDHPLLRSARLLFSEMPFQCYFFLIGFSFKEFSWIFDYVRLLSFALRNNLENPIRKLTTGIGEVIKTRRANNMKRADLLQFLMDAETTIKPEVKDAPAIEDKLKENSEAYPTGSSPDEERQKENNPMLTDQQIIMNSFMMYLAGYETTSNALGFTTHALVKYPEVQDRLRTEVQNLVKDEGELSITSIQKLPYLDQVITESLRMYPPLYLFTNREALEDIKIKDFLIPKGMVVQIPVYWLHHNPEFWENPGRFDPSRFDKETDVKNQLIWQPFGAGPRNCIGMRFALMEAKLAIAKLLLKFRLEPGDRMDYKDDLHVRISTFILSPSNGVYVKALPLGREGHM